MTTAADPASHGPRTHHDLVIVGGGPRAVAVIARLAARLRPGVPYGGSAPAGPAALRVAIVDAIEVGSGATWWTGQHRLLLNNTYSAHTTAHADESTAQEGPLVPGPDLVEWAVAVREGTGPSLPLPPRPAWVTDEVTVLRPESYPTRRLQGVYYREQLSEAAHRGGIEVTHVRGTVVDLATGDGRDTRVVRLREAEVVAFDGPQGHRVVTEPAPVTSLTTPYVVLAQGMVQARRSARTTAFVEASSGGGLVYVEPGMPAERDWSVVPGNGEPVLVAGLGANFFDVVGILTGGRGGRFVDAATGDPVDAAGQSTQDGGAGGPAAGAELRYLPSGEEPRLLAGSRRGLPYRGKGAYPESTGGLPPRWRPVLATPEALRAAAGDGVRDFRRELWPLIARELAAAHLLTLLEHRPSSLRPGLERDDVLDAVREGTDPAEVTGDVVIDPEAAIDLERLDRPEAVETPDQWEAWLQRWLVAEQDSIARPLTSPRNAVNRAMNTLRGQVARLVRDGLVDGAAVEGEIERWFVPLGLALASGPPPRRTAQLFALVRAGIVELIGEDLSVDIDGEGFVARTRAHGGGTGGGIAGALRARAFIETRMSKGKVAGTDDPLLSRLLDSGRARLHRRPSAVPAGAVETPTLDVTAEGFELLDAAGTADPRVLAIGIPAEAVQPGSAIGATPGLPSPLLAGADRAAARVLAGIGAPVAAIASPVGS